MPSFVHIFIGKEYSNLVEGIGRAAHKYCGGTTASDISYLRVDYSGNNLAISRLIVTPTVEDASMGCLDRYLETKWEQPQSAQGTVAVKEFGAVWSDLYNELFTINNSGAFQGLTVIIHFPLYKAEAYDVYEHIYAAINSLNKPTRVNSMGYFDDLAKIVEPSYKIKSPSKNQIAKYKEFRTKQQMDVSSMLIALQNTTYNGVSLGLTEEGLKEVVAQFVCASSLFYQDLFPPTLDYKDVVAVGVASLQVDKYLLVDYLMNRAFCNAMDIASVNGTEVDINDALEVADRLLIDKHKLLSDLFKSNVRDDAEAKERFRNEVSQIIEKSEEIFKREKSITMKAAILAALLSKTDCSLFSESIYNDHTASIRDLFGEALDYFIANDYGQYFAYEGKPLFNPIAALKDLDAKIINSENEVRRLSKDIDELGKQIADAENVEKCYFDPEHRIFHFNDEQFIVLPDDIKPELLEENYTPVSTTNLPESVDLRGGFNPIRSQGNQGSCVAFAITSIYEYVIYKKTRELLDLSEAFLFYNARDIDPNDDISVEFGDRGSRECYAIESLGKFGIALEADCPYDERVHNKRPSEEAYKEALNRTLIKALNVERKVEVFKAALAEGHPITGGFVLCKGFFKQTSVDGYVQMPTEAEIYAALNPSAGEEQMHGRHEMVIVGYSDKLQCFIIRNSWNARWGDGGYCYMPYAYIEDDRLMNFAAIITDIKTDNVVEAEVVDADVQVDGNQNQNQNEKDGQQETPQYDVPTLTMDDGDIRMRYYINLALLSKEGDILRDFYNQRSKMLKDFESITSTLASKPSNRDEFIAAAMRKLEAEDQELRTEKRVIDEAIEKDAKAMKIYNLKITLLFVGITAVTFLLLYLWNFKLVPIFDDPLWIERLTINGMWSLVVIVPSAAFLAYRAYDRWSCYRETVNAYRLRLKAIDARLQELKGIMSEFKFKTFAAWHLLREVLHLQSHFSTLYTKYLSLINNLRAWYIEVQHKTNEVVLDKATPNISLLNQKLADKLFDETISKDKVSEIDFTANMDAYSLAEDYIVEYKRILVDMVASKLLQHPAIANFNLTEHIVGPAVDWVRDVDKVLAAECSRKSDIFVHLSSVANPDMQRTEYLIACEAKQNESRLYNKFNTQPCCLNWENAHVLSYISVATLSFDDCEVAQ